MLNQILRCLEIPTPVQSSLSLSSCLLVSDPWLCLVLYDFAKPHIAFLTVDVEFECQCYK